MIKVRRTGNLQKEFEREVQLKTDIVITKSLVDLKLATPVLTGKAAAGWEKKSNSIINEVEYIDELNAGTSQQAPEYFIERTLLAQEGVHPSGTIVRSI